MGWRNVVEISKNVFWVGVKDWNRRLFDAFIPLPKGTSYNAYLVVGDEQKALIDTVNPGFEEELEEKIRQVLDPSDLDLVVMNHAEPDHAGAIPYLMKVSKKAKLLATGQGVKMAKIYFKVPDERLRAASDGERIRLGGKTLRFIHAPMLHWPETMFTYLEEDGVLFSCDFFGTHTAKETFDHESVDIMVYAQGYFGEIMMPFRSMGKKALEKIKDLEIKMIAPSHGPIYKEPGKILKAYEKWTSGETVEKALVIYVSMWGASEKMAFIITDTLLKAGVEVALHNLSSLDLMMLAKDLVDARALVIAAPTVLGGAHPLALYAAYLVKALRPPTKYAAILTCYGWSGGALKQLKDVLEPLKLEFVGTMEINGPPTEDDVKRIVEIGSQLAVKVKEQ